MGGSEIPASTQEAPATAPGTAWHSTGPAARRPWGFPTCTGLRIPAGQASLGCAYAHANCPSCAWAVLCIWPTQTQGLLINWTCCMVACGVCPCFYTQTFRTKASSPTRTLGIYCLRCPRAMVPCSWYYRQNPGVEKLPAPKSQPGKSTGPRNPGCSELLG